MSRQIEDGELCPSCNEIPIAFYGHDRAECPNCGERVVRSGNSDDEDDDEFNGEDFDEDI
jgi:predicted RNA-binding Zn-ribbon protein involved in translation (DUF1610 family)